MRLFLVSIMAFGLGAGATFAQTGIGELFPSAAVPGSPQGSPASVTKAPVLPALRLLLPGHAARTITSDPSAKILHATPAEEISPQRQWPSRPLSPERTHDSEIADCMQMWDSRTHMTKQEWSRTCKRVQTRLDSLNFDVLMPKAKTQIR